VSIDPNGGRVYAATGNNYTEPVTDTSDAFIAFDGGTGTMAWTSQRYVGDVWSYYAAALGNPDADFGANPILFETEIGGVMTELIGGGQKSGDVHAVLRSTGEKVWSRKLGPGNLTGQAGVFNNGAWDGNHLLFVCNSATSDAPGSEPKDAEASVPSVLFALDGATGDIVWERQLPGEVMGPVTSANGVGFVGADKQLLAFNVDTGEVLFRHRTTATIASAPTVANGRVAFGNGLTWVFGHPGSLLTILGL
jgi:polyvinyl alcohol dehydrogenase (cytochrome)